VETVPEVLPIRAARGSSKAANPYSLTLEFGEDLNRQIGTAATQWLVGSINSNLELLKIGCAKSLPHPLAEFAMPRHHRNREGFFARRGNRSVSEELESGGGRERGRGFVMGIWGRRGYLSVWVWELCGDSTAGWLAAGTGPATASRARPVPFTPPRRPGGVTREGRVGGADPSRLSSQAEEEKPRRSSGVSAGGMWMAEWEQREHTTTISVVGQQNPCAP
jgi:hypothetical protein